MEIVKIDLVPSGVMPSCHASQYDIGREIRFLLTDGGAEYTLAGTETISIELRKPDGTSETIAIPNTSSNYVDWETSDGELDLSGVYLAEISIKNGDDVLGSANFIVKTEADAYDGTDIRTITVGPADICTFETTLPEPYQSVIVDVLASGGNGTPDNPIPIVGYSLANITRCGVNLWELSDDTKNDGDRVTIEYINNGVKLTANDLYARASYVYNVKAGQTYTLSYYGYGTANFIQVYYNDEIAWNPQNYGRQLLTSTRTKYTKTITATSDILFIGFYVTSTGSSGDMVIEDFMLEVGSTASDTFAPYNGQTYAIAFGQTVYGGVLDVTRGKLKLLGAELVLDGTQTPWITNWRPQANSVGWYYHYGLTNNAIFGPNEVPNMLCDVCEAKAYNSLYNDDVVGVGLYTSNYAGLFVRVADTSLTTPEMINAYLSANPMTIVYPLATPFDIDLTPEVMSAIVGENNVFADCGKTTVKYLKVGG